VLLIDFNTALVFISHSAQSLIGSLKMTSTSMMLKLHEQIMFVKRNPVMWNLLT